MRDGLAIFDRDGNLVRWNSSARAITGWTPGEAGQRGLAALPPGVIQIRDGKWVDARHLRIDEGTVVLFTDVTAQVSLRDAHQRLDDLSLIEAVTGLPNRRLALGQIMASTRLNIVWGMRRVVRSATGRRADRAVDPRKRHGGTHCSSRWRSRTAWLEKRARSGAASAWPRTRGMPRTPPAFQSVANMGVRTAKLAGGRLATETARLVQTPDP
ncbi:MAG: hypothetical protein ACRDG6_10910 [Candidatus Limnocylindria bacterium]